jgi:Sec-independent protein secretion pathway component TatC
VPLYLLFELSLLLATIAERRARVTEPAEVAHLGTIGR